jgi:Cu+-exporting ATPase
VVFLLGEAASKRARLEPKDAAAAPGAVLRRARRTLEHLAVGAAVATFVTALVTGSSLPRSLAVAAAALAALSVESIVGGVAQRKRKTVAAAAAEGIRYRDADAFDRAGQVDRALFCGASTLFTGEPQIVAIEPVGTVTPARLLELAAAGAVVAEHPAARSFVEAAAQEGAAPCELRNVSVRRDEGVVAVCPTGERLVCGGRTFLLKEHVSVAMSDARVSELEAEGRSVLLVALGGKILGLVALQEGLRDGARPAVQALLDVRIEPVLVSHDARATCEALARSLDIDHIRPELVPDDVGREVRDLAEGVHVVAVVGDPGRDLAALAAASVPIAVGRSNGGDWPVSVASRDPRRAAAAVTIPRRYRESAKRAFALAAAPGVLGAVGLFLNVLPPVAGPLFALLGIAVSAGLASRSA